MIHPASMEFFLEPALLNDVPTMDRLEQEAFSTPWSQELLRGAILNREYVVRVLRHPVHGLVGFYISHGVEERCNLDNLVVHPSFRNQGHGSALIQDWAQTALTRGLSRLTLQVNTANLEAQRLYARLGFHKKRLLVSYYPNGEDAFLMVRETQLGAPDETGMPKKDATRTKPPSSRRQRRK